MNRVRRKELSVIMKKLAILDGKREEIREQLSIVLEAEQEALDNLPESLQTSTQAELMQECIDTMENVAGELDLMDIEDLMEQLSRICG